MARTDLYYLALEWEPAINVSKLYQNWNIFWDCTKPKETQNQTVPLSFAEMMNVTTDLASGEYARGAADYYTSVRERLSDETRILWDGYLTHFLPLTDEQRDELGTAAGISRSYDDVWNSFSPRTISNLVHMANKIDTRAFSSQCDHFVLQDPYVPDCDSFLGLLSGYRKLHKRLAQKHHGLVVLVAF
jgi:hypothetical protein